VLAGDVRQCSEELDALHSKHIGGEFKDTRSEFKAHREGQRGWIQSKRGAPTVYTSWYSKTRSTASGS
jgi:hypothetical protein